MAASIAALTVVIQLSNLSGAPDAVVRDSQIEVAGILLDIGVVVEWTAPNDQARDCIHLTLVPVESGSLTQLKHQVLGTATRTQLGTKTALIFFRRVAEEADAYAVPVSRVLACAIAHEIGHLLQTEPSHEPSGLMRALWTRADFRQLSAGRLRFTTSPGTDHAGR